MKFEGNGNMLAEQPQHHHGLAVNSGDSVSLALPQGTSFDRLWLMEDLKRGQRIAGFTVEIQSQSGDWDDTPWSWLFPCSVVGACAGGGGGPQGSGDSPWLPTVRRVAVFNGTSVGHKRIIKLARNGTTEAGIAMGGKVIYAPSCIYIP